jgi:hypothetical protein
LAFRRERTTLAPHQTVGDYLAEVDGLSGTYSDLLAHALASATPRRVVRGQLALEEFFAAVELLIWIIQPTLTPHRTNVAQINRIFEE